MNIHLRSARSKRIRAAVFFSILIAVPLTTLLVIQLARGYRPDISNRTLRPTGLLVARSSPEGAVITVQGKQVGTTDKTINLDPGVYTVGLEKPEYHPWEKLLTIEKELVTRTDAILFPLNLVPKPEHTATTSIAISPDYTQLIYSVPKPLVPPSSPTPSPRPGTSVSPTPIPQLPLGGLYTIDLSDSTLNLDPSGPHLIATNTTRLDWSKSVITWSPDNRQILTRFPVSANCTDFDRPKNPCTVASAYLLDPTRNNNQPVNIISGYKQLLANWLIEKETQDIAKLLKIPLPLVATLTQSVNGIQFSPDETKILYTATASASLPDQVIPPIPAANTQPEERNLKPGQTYVYDIKEDKNFAIGEAMLVTPTPKGQLSTLNSPLSTYSWFPSSRHLIQAQDRKITVTEYDGSNKTQIFAGALADFPVFTSTAGRRLFLLLDLDQDPKTLPGLYSLNLRP